MIPAVTLLFPTSLVVGSIMDEFGLTAELRAAIGAQHRVEDQAYPPRSGQAWRAREDMARWGGVSVERLQRVLAKMADRLTIDTKANGASRYDWYPALRAHVARAGETVTTKHRPDAFWGGLCFIDDGYDSDHDALAGGEVEIEDPRLPATLGEAPELRLRLNPSRHVTYHESAIFRPSRDQLLLYPAWLRITHLPFHGPGIRMWITIDLVARRRTV